MLPSLGYNRAGKGMHRIKAALLGAAVVAILVGCAALGPSAPPPSDVRTPPSDLVPITSLPPSAVALTPALPPTVTRSSGPAISSAAVPAGTTGVRSRPPVLAAAPPASTPPSSSALTPTPFWIDSGTTPEGEPEIRPTRKVDWASLGALLARQIQRGTPFGTFPPDVSADGRLIGFCDARAVTFSRDAGQTWQTIPFDPNLLDLRDVPWVGVPAFRVAPFCVAVTLDPRHAASVFVDLAVPDTGSGMIVPTVFLGYETTDDGRTWARVPNPLGNGWEGFGGFARWRGAVQARFGRILAGAGAFVFGTVVEETGDGGRSWRASSSVCRASFSCLRWGASPPFLPKWGGSAGAGQMLQESFDGGTSWANISTEPAIISGRDYADLAIVSARRVALVRSGEAPAFLLSDDSARTWIEVVLPPLRDGAPANLLQLLPNGTLLGRDSLQAPWEALQPRAKTWCPVNPGVLPASIDGMRASNRTLWWVGSGLKSVSLDRIRCNG